MFSLLVKDKKLRQIFLKKEKAIRINKFIFVNIFGQKLIKNNLKKLGTLLFLKKKIFNQSISKTKFTNRCIESNRNRGVLRIHSVSRLVLREYIQFGIIPGYKKAVW